MDSFIYFDQNKADGDIFNGAMTGFAFQDVPTVVAVYDFSKAQRVADIGGGEGSLLRALLQSNPTAKGVYSPGGSGRNPEGTPDPGWTERASRVSNRQLLRANTGQLQPFYLALSLLA
jgi:hypothetical protein